MKTNGWKSVIVLLAAILLLCSSAFAEEQAELLLQGTEEESAYVVTIDLIGTDTVEMLQFCVAYDDDLLRLESVSVGNAFRGTSYPTVSGDIEGKLYFAWEALSPLPAGQLLVIRFTAKNNAVGTAHVRIDGDEELIAANGEYQMLEVKRTAIEFVLYESYDAYKEGTEESETGTSTESSEMPEQKAEPTSSSEPVIIAGAEPDETPNESLWSRNEENKPVETESAEVLEQTAVPDLRPTPTEDTNGAAVQLQTKLSPMVPIAVAGGVFALAVIIWILKTRKQTKRNKGMDWEE